MNPKVTYGREEGGFAVYHDGRKVAIFRIKGWMNGLRDIPDNKAGQSIGHRSNRFYQTQYEYHGKSE